MIIRILLLLSLFIGYSSTYAQIGAKVQQKDNILGVWQNNQFGYQMSLILNQDGTGEFDGETLTYTIKGNLLTILAGPESTTYTYKMEGKSLLLSGGDLDKEIIFIHPGDTSDGNVSGNQDQQKILPTPPTAPPTNTPNDITGVWSGSGETIEFKPDGQCVYLGSTFPYELSQGYLTVKSAQGSAVFKYVIQGDQLTLTGSGGSISYIRGGAATGQPQQSHSGTKEIAIELVGKWCFVDVNSYNQGASSSSECVTLNADGTYIYESESSRSVNTADFNGGTNSQSADRGTWSYDGDRLYVQSQSKGPLSYKLEKRNHPKNVNDPMIVIDGRAFVTAYNKPPWR